MNEEQIKEMTETTSRCKSNTHRIDALEKNTTLMYKMSENIAVIAEQTKDTKEDVKTLKIDVEEIKSKPNKLVDKAKTQVLGIVIGGIVGAIMALIL